MRPPATHDRVLAILCDGARPDVMMKMAAAGELPVVKQHFVDAGGFRSGTSVFPTVSGPAHLPMLTGAHPGRANLPGIRWAERPSGKLGFAGRTRSYMTPFRGAKLERDVPAGVTTLFEHVEGLADINTWFVRGCPDKARFTKNTMRNHGLFYLCVARPTPARSGCHDVARRGLTIDISPTSRMAPTTKRSPGFDMAGHRMTFHVLLKKDPESSKITRQSK